MRTEIRTTGQGTEYWDNIEKRTVFVPTGKKPNFKVTKNPKSMVHVEEKPKKEEDQIELSKMNLKQLKEYAAELPLEIPEEAKTKAQVIEVIQGKEANEDK